MKRAWLALGCLLMSLAAGCATEDPFRKQPVRVAYEVGDQVRAARPQFQSLWNWYLQAIDPKAPTTEVEVCLTIAPDGKVLDAYIDSSTIRRKEFTEEVVKIYNGMRFAARDVPELTLCDDPLLFYALGEKPDPNGPRYGSAFAFVPPEEESDAPEGIEPTATEAAPPRPAKIPDYEPPPEAPLEPVGGISLDPQKR